MRGHAGLHPPRTRAARACAVVGWRAPDSATFRKEWPASAAARSAAQALGHEGLANDDVGPGDQLGEYRCGGGMHFARAMGREGSIVGVDLGGPEHVRIVLGP